MVTELSKVLTMTLNVDYYAFYCPILMNLTNKRSPENLNVIKEDNDDNFCYSVETWGMSDGLHFIPLSQKTRPHIWGWVVP